MSPCFHSPIIESPFRCIVALGKSESLPGSSGLDRLSRSQCRHPTPAQRGALSKRSLNVEHFSAISFRRMRSMTGYGRGETDHAGTKFSVELNSVNRKKSDVVINVPRDLVELEPRIRQTINESISRGRTNATVTLHTGANGARNLALNTELARSYHEAMHALQKELNVRGEITIATILQAPGVMRFPEEALNAEDMWPAVELPLRVALAVLIRMREREGKHLAKDLIRRLKAIRKKLKEVRALHPEVVKRYRIALLDRIEKAGLPLANEDERVL